MRDSNGTARPQRDCRDDLRRDRPSVSPRSDRPAYYPGQGKGAGALAVGRRQAAPSPARGLS
jgi:hypothetical protein